MSAALSPEEKREIIRLHNLGWSNVKIASQIGRSATAVNNCVNHFIELGVFSPPKSDLRRRWNDLLPKLREAVRNDVKRIIAERAPSR
jgi:IS30 family transposase